MLTSAEGKGTGLQWETLFTRDRPDDPLSMGSVLIMFVIDIIFYSFFIAYVDKVAPGRDGKRVFTNISFVKHCSIYLPLPLT